MDWTIYVDLDAFYVACEVRDRPELLGRPVIVGADPSRGPSRGVVLSASYEARAFGARSAMPVARANALVPNAVWIPPDFEKYESTSRSVFARLAAFAERLVPLSIDEAALTWPAPGIEEARRRAVEIQEVVDREFRLSASLGVATHRTVAKIASDRQKPHGITVVPADGIRDFLAPLPARVIPGIGPKTGERLDRAGMRTVNDLLIAGRNRLRPILGGFTTEVLALARGEPLPIPPDARGPHLRSSDRTFGEDVRELEPLRSTLAEMAGDLTASIQREGYVATGVGVAVRWEDFDRSQRSRTLPHSVSEAESIRKVAEPLLRALWAAEQRSRKRGVRTLSLRLERLRPTRGRQAHLDGESAGPDLA